MCSLEKFGSIYILTLSGDDHQWLNPTLLDSIRAALHQLKSETTSSALITTAHGKFFSNGMDLAWANSDKTRLLLLFSKMKSLIADLLSLSMPTIAAVSGHASGGGFLLALSHDYILTRKDRGFLYMSEQDIGLTVPTWCTLLLRTKLGSASTWRDIVLGSAKLTADTAVKKGIVESAHDGQVETMKAAVELGDELVKRKWDGHVYAQNRMTLYSEALAALDVDDHAYIDKYLSRL